MSYILSKKSLRNLEDVHPKLVEVVKLAIQITKQDFMVIEGVRSLAQQKCNVQKGMSQTMNSKHLPQRDGFGHAVDLVPYLSKTKSISWDLQYFYPIAEAMRLAGKQLGINIRWGGCWLCLNSTQDTCQNLVYDYSAKRKKQGKKAFIDAPHFEIL